MANARWSAFHERAAEAVPQLRPSHASYRWLVLASVMISTFMAVLDATIVNVALSKLMSSFGVSVDKVEWVLTAYLLVFGVMLPTSGWLADHIGHKRVFIAGLMIFTGSSFLCSLAWNLNALITFRIMQGAGAGILMPVGMAIITREFPPEMRGMALGFWSMAASASVSLGPAIGGYLIENYSWHAVFDVNVPVGIVGMAAALFVLREHRSEDVRTFDIVGFISLAAFLTSLLLALANGNSAWNTGGWQSAYIRTCFAVSAVALVVFLIAEFTVPHPLIELALFRNFNFATSNVLMFLFGFGMFGSTFLLPIYLQNSLGYTALQAGLVFLPVGLLQMVSAPLAGNFADRSSPKIPAILGITLMAFTFYQFSFLSFLSERREIMLPLYLRGIAMGIMLPPLMTLAISEIPNRKMAQASGLINVIRQIGGSFGVAVFGTILTRRAIYHAAMYGERIDPHSHAFTETVTRLEGHALRAAGEGVAAATGAAKAQIASFVANQAFISAISACRPSVSCCLRASVPPDPPAPIR
jgi:DHA2 family multidrug resistance protein